MKLLKCLIVPVFLGICLPSYAKLVQIIHTNDLHSFFSGLRNGKGGYARLKTLVERLKSEAAIKGIPTLFLDAGDFGEGSSYYYSNDGVDAIHALDLLGVDVSVLGNHDFFLGGEELARQLEKAQFSGHMLSANLRGKKLMSLKGQVKDYVDYNVEDFKIRIFGLTTAEIHYQYPLVPKNIITSAHKMGIKMGHLAQKDRVDFLIALTHIGVENDMNLVAHSRSIDMVIGGHSHTRLEAPRVVTNLRGESIPVFQTGAHGIAVGSILVDIQGKSNFKLIDYKLHDVTSDIPEDPKIKTFVELAHSNREAYFNRNWNEVIGESEIILTGMFDGKVRNGRSCWSRHIARMTREAANAEIGFQFDQFQGEEIPSGPITFGDLIDNFPHFRKWGDKGWNVARARVPGLVITQLLRAFGQHADTLNSTLDGIWTINKGTNELVPFEIGGIHDAEEALINGEKIVSMRLYEIAIPSEIPHAMKLLGPFRFLLMSKLEYVEGTEYWEMVENYIRNHSPLRCSTEN